MIDIASVLVIRAERGKVVSSEVLSGDLSGLVRAYTVKAAEEWDPGRSDLIALKDEREAKVEQLSPAALRELERVGARVIRGRGSLKIVFPVFTVSFDNAMISEKEYVENKIYLIAPYVNDEVKEQLELEAAEITSPPEEVGGIREIG